MEREEPGRGVPTAPPPEELREAQVLAFEALRHVLVPGR